jgi:putative transcriptional regulator
MTIQHHPNEETLLDYVSGAMSEAWSLAIATHLALCPTCRHEVEGLEALAGSLLEAIQPDEMPSGLLSHNANLLTDAAQELPARRSSRSDETAKPDLPQPLRDYIGGGLGSLKWRRFGVGAAQIIVPTADAECTVRLLRIPAGKPVPEHSHNGLEFTLVLSGSFSDDSGRYGPGDLQEADGDVLHQPIAGDGEDCICLAITDAPLKFSSLAARMVQPFIGI